MVTTYLDPGTAVDPDVRKTCAEIVKAFPAIPNVWGYSSASTSDHRNRRCIDYMVIGQKSDAARIALGTAIANYHIKHSKRLGVNGIIWNGRVMGFPHVANPPYRGPAGAWRPYSGSSNPHRDHVHVEYDGSAYEPLTPPTPPKPATYSQLIVLDAPGGGNWQGAAQNIKSGEWFIAQSRGRDDGGEDTVLYRFDKTGKYRDSMTLLKASHVTGFGVSDTNIIWAPWNDKSGNDIVTLQYAPGKSITKLNGGVSQMHVFSDRPVDISFSPTRYWAVLRQAGYPAGKETYRLYAKKDILAGNDDKFGHDVVIGQSSSRVVQGFSVADKFLYVLIGLNPSSPFRIEKWSFATGKKVGELKLPASLGMAAGMTGKNEPEGMDGRRFCMKSGEGDKRRLTVFELKNF